MGITGLIPLLEKAKAAKHGHISQFTGGTVAIDSYCWLHKGAFSCADKIAMGQQTDAYVKYCMKFVHMLLANRIKPILVFDGRYLPAKKETEVKRRQNREATRRQAAELMRMGQTAEGRNLLRRSVDITHEMALEVIKQCQEENVDCIVAPYEADAQLAYLNISGIADVVITEDSDLTLFGCTKIFFKMDLTGNGLLVEQDRLHLAMNMRADHFDIDKFRHMCILSGCDYLASLPGIGLSKACKFIVKNSEADIHKALPRLGSYLNMKSLVVTQEYRDSFIRAFVTFKHQLVYCPLQRKQVRLNPPSPEVTDEQLHFAGDEVSEDIAWQLALGNYDPFTMKELHNFDPDQPRNRRRKTNSWHEKPGTEYVSIWSKNFKICEEKENGKTTEITKWPDTAGRVLILNTNSIKMKAQTPKKRNFGELAEELTTNDLIELYGSKKLQKNDATEDGRSTPPPELPPSPLKDEESTSPILSRRSNPFVKPASEKNTSPSLVCRGKRRLKLKSLVGFRPTVIDDRVVQESKYFSTNATADEAEKKEERISVDCAKIIDFQQEEPSEDPRDKAREICNKDLNGESENDETSNSSGIFLSQESREQDFSPERKSSELVSSMEVEPCTRRSDSNLHDLDKLLDSKCDIASQDSITITSSQREDDARDFSIREESVTSLRSSLFQWANPKVTGNTSTTVVKSNPPKQRAITAKTKTTRKITTQKKPASTDSQQSLLNMFGFQKKTVLKH